MTVPTKRQAQSLFDAAERIKHQLGRHIQCMYDHKAVQLLYMTQAEIEETEAFLYKYVVDPTASPIPTVTTGVTFTSPYSDMPIHLDATFNLHLPYEARRKTIWPRDRMWLRPNADEAVAKELEGALSEYTQMKHDFHIFSVVLNFITGLRSFEEMRYLFPPILRVFRNAGLGDIAYKLEDARKPPKMSPLTGEMRKAIRYAIQWVTVQELLGTLDNVPEGASGNMVTFSLNGPITASVKDADGNVVEVYVPS